MGSDAGWHPDPTGRFEQRYFDGAVWTEHVAAGGEQRTDPLEAGAPQAERSAVATPPSAPPVAAPPPGAFASTSPTPTGGAAPSGGPPPGSSPAPAELLIMGSAAVFVIATFLPWYSIDGITERGRGASVDWTAWSNAWSLQPLTTLMAAVMVGLGALVLLDRFTAVAVPERIARVRLEELSSISAVVIAVTTLGFLLRDADNLTSGAGLMLATIASFGMVVGTVLRHKASAPPEVSGGEGVAPAQGPKLSPGDLIVVAGAAGVTIGSFLPVLGIGAFADSSRETGRAWSEGQRFLWVVPVVLGLVMAARVLAKLTSARVPERVVGLGWNQILLVFGIWSTLMLLSFLVGEPFLDIVGAIATEAGMSTSEVRELLSRSGETVPSVSREGGFWLMFAGAVALAVGAIVRDREARAAS